MNILKKVIPLLAVLQALHVPVLNAGNQSTGPRNSHLKATRGAVLCAEDDQLDQLLEEAQAIDDLLVTWPPRGLSPSEQADMFNELSEMIQRFPDPCAPAEDNGSRTPEGSSNDGFQTEEDLTEDGFVTGETASDDGFVTGETASDDGFASEEDLISNGFSSGNNDVGLASETGGESGGSAAVDQDWIDKPLDPGATPETGEGVTDTGNIDPRPVNGHYPGGYVDGVMPEGSGGSPLGAPRDPIFDQNTAQDFQKHPDTDASPDSGQTPEKESALTVRVHAVPSWKETQPPNKPIAELLPGTPLKVLSGIQTDPDFSVFKWIRIQVLQGRYKGTIGWVHPNAIQNSTAQHKEL